MEGIGELWRRLLFLFRHRRFDLELEEEMQFHLEMQAEEQRQEGASATESAWAARRQFGNATLLREDSRAAWGWGALERLAQDVKYAFRGLRNNPAFTAVAVLTLASGIGANTAIFSAVNALLLNPFPFFDPDRLVSVDARHVSGRNSNTGYRDFMDWREQSTVFEDMAIVPWAGSYTLSGEGDAQRITGGATTAGFFSVLGVRPALGRFFTAEEDRPGAPLVVVLSYATWQRRFGGSESVLGRSLALNDKQFTIVGVMPSRFAFPGISTCEFWTPLRESPANSRTQHQYGVLARLKAGVTVEQAQACMTRIAAHLEQEFPASNRGWGVVVEPLASALAQQTRRPLAVLLLAVVFVLALACANLAALLLARASSRTQEIAVRLALGAGRARIVRQMLTESAVLAILGGGLGLAFARWLMNIILLAAPADFGLESAIRLDPKVLAFTFALSLLTGIAFGLAPAWYGSKSDLTCAVKGGGQAGSGSRSRNRLLSALVAGEIAVTLVLLAGAGLLAKDFVRLLRVDTGLRAEHVLTFAVDLPAVRYPTAHHITAFYDGLLSRLGSAAGVEAASGIGMLPMSGGWSGGGFEIEGRPKPADWMDMSAQYNDATPGYFRTMGIPLLRGRDFDASDNATAPPVAIINDTLARQFFPGEDPLGHRIQRGGKLRTIVGIAGSAKHSRPSSKYQPQVYFPFAQAPGGLMWIAARTTGDPAKLASVATGLVRSLDPNVPVLRLRAMPEVVSDSLAEARLLTSFLAGFAAFALALAAIGIYGVTAFSVAQRTHEMGVRVSLGATSRDVLSLVVRQAVRLAAVGTLAGIPLALVASRLLGTVLYGVSPHDLSIFLAVPWVVVLVVLAASYVPARRASRVDPIAVLRVS